MPTKRAKTHHQIFWIFIACMGSLSQGMSFAWSSPSIPRIVDDPRYNITLAEASYFTVLPAIGAIVSSLLYSELIDWIGRKNTLLSIVIPATISNTLLATCKSLTWLYVARFVTGFGDSCLFAALPSYVAEIATPTVRGTWGNSMTFLIYVGQFFMNIIGSYFDVPLASSLILVPIVIFIVIFPFAPETPYYLLMKGKRDAATKALRHLRQQEDVSEELEKLEKDVERQMSESGRWSDLVTISSNRRAVYAGVFLRASQQLSGTGSFVVYTQYIFIQAGGDVSASTAAIIFQGLAASLNLCASFVIDRWGRRASYTYSCLLCGICLSVVAVYFFLQRQTNVDVAFINWLPLAGLISYVIFYSFGLGIVPTLMLGELFSTSVKAKGLCILNIVFGALIALGTKLFHLLESGFGLFVPFLFFAICCFISTIMAIYFVPETKGKTLEEIQQSLKNKSKT